MDDLSRGASASAYTSLVDLIQHRSQYGSRRVFTFLPDGEAEGPTLTYEELGVRARAIAAELQGRGLAGERAVLFYPSGLEFLTAFCGCLFAGVVAIPVFPARRAGDLARLAAIVTDSQPSVVLTESRSLSRARKLCQQTAELSALEWQATDEISSERCAGWKNPGAGRRTLAFLQYTSGSTQTPRGVMISHGNVLHNLHSIQRIYGFTPDRLGVTWLPHFHDMGLIGGLLEPIYAGCASMVMPAAAFLQRPYRWLAAVTRYGASTMVAPNFAYDLCVRRISLEERESLRLDSVTVAVTGAEPVRAETLARFAEAFGPCGFRRGAFRPAYGLAEATLTVSGQAFSPADSSAGSTAGSADAVVCKVDAAALARNRVEPAAAESACRALVASGGIVPETEVLIVDPETSEPCSSDCVGEIWVAGPGVAQGYWRRPEETERTFEACLGGRGGQARNGTRRYLRTGDLGFFHEGNLVVTGRLNDRIIIRGANHYAQDLEQTVGIAHPALRPGRGAAFAVDIGGAERLAIVHEVEEADETPGAEIVEAIRGALVESHEVQPQAIVLIEPNSIFKTSSGKIQRFACRQAYLDGKLPVIFQWREEAEDEDLSVRSGHASASKVAERSGLVWDYRPAQMPARGVSGNGSRKTPRGASEQTGGTGAGQTSRRASRNEDEPIAIIGLGCRFPGADSLDALWGVLREGKDAITEVPADRWDVDALYDPIPGTSGKMNTRWGGFLEGVDLFDAHFFGISPREASAMDPQQRLLLEVAWEALETAGQAPDKLAGSKTGVFVGIGGFDYSYLIQTRERYIEKLNAFAGTGLAHSVAANRLSYLLDLRGPSVALDTACSSSLVCIHLACESLRNRQSDLALAGGVNLILSPATTVAFSQARMMASDGRCKTFDARADGYVRSEGCGIAVLKRLPEALSARDNILAVIRGSAVNQDGRTAGISAPNGPAQQAVIREALAQAGIEPRELTYLELHGTGTSVGDPIEVDAVKAVLAEAGADAGAGGQPCLLGSVKANIGHLENASGIAGLAKVVLCLQHERIPAQIHLRKLNPRISLHGTRLEIPRALQSWPAASRGGPRIAGVNSFGFGGTNAHLTVEEAPRVERSSGRAPRPWHLFTLSARTAAALEGLARRFVHYFGEHPDEEIADICFTANAGRSHFAHRMAVVVKDTADLRQRLADFADGGRADGLACGSADKRYNRRIEIDADGGLSDAGRDVLESEGFDTPLASARSSAHPLVSARSSADPLVSAGSVDERAVPEPEEQPGLTLLRRLGAFYVRGGTIDWDRFDAASGARKVCLPTYPFERERYWDPPSRAVAERIRLDPLLGRRLASPLPELQFETRLDDRRLRFLRDHRVQGAAVLPAAAYLDMALAAAREVFGRGAHSVEDVTFHRAARLSDENAASLQLIVSQALEGSSVFRVFSRSGGDEASGWMLHASGRIRKAGTEPAPAAEPREPLAGIRARSMETGGKAEFYAALRRRGLEYGPAFQAIERYWRCEHEALAEISLAMAGAQEEYQIHPALLDACLQSLAAAFVGESGSAGARFAYLPTSIAKFQLVALPQNQLFSHCVLRPGSEFGAEFLEADIRLLDEQSAVMAELCGLKVKRVGAEISQRNLPLRSGVPRQEDAQQEILSRAALLVLDPVGQQVALLAHLRGNMARLMGVEKGAIDSEETLDRLGIDSLMAFELEDALETSLGLKLPTEILMGMPSLNELAGRLVVLLRASESGVGGGAVLTASAAEPAIDTVIDGAVGRAIDRA